MAVALALDATMTGAITTGNLTVRILKLKLGESSVSASGSWDLSKQAGAVQLRELVVAPGEVRELTDQELLSDVRGEGDLHSDGKTAQLDLRLHGGRGTRRPQDTAPFAQPP